jgi:hypothetical protein
MEHIGKPAIYENTKYITGYLTKVEENAAFYVTATGYG